MSRVIQIFIAFIDLVKYDSFITKKPYNIDKLDKTNRYWFLSCSFRKTNTLSDQDQHCNINARPRLKLPMEDQDDQDRAGLGFAFAHYY